MNLLCCGVLLSLLLIPVPVMATTIWERSSDTEGWSVSALAIDPLSPQAVYAGTSGNVFKSTDGGVSWGSLLSDVSVNALAIDPTSPRTIYAGTNAGGVLKSIDGGDSWQALNNGLPNTLGQGYWVLCLAVDPTSPGTVYAGTIDGVYKTTDGGDYWCAVNSGLTYDNQGVNPSVLSLAIDPTAPQTVYAGTRSGGVFKSTNGGGFWSAVNSGISGTSIYSLAIDQSNPQAVYAGTMDSGLYRSTTGGGSWGAVNSGLTGTWVNSLAIDPMIPQTIYAGTYGSGVFKSTTGGGSWSAVNSGLTNTYVNTLAIDPTRPHTVYAGTQGGGVFKGLSDLPPPTISGTPPPTATVGSAYGFTPSSTNADSFSITGIVPAGLGFSSATGTLSGTPTAAGAYGDITISVTNASGSASLPAFSITVTGDDTLPNARIWGSQQLYGLLQPAYNDAATGAVIQARGITFVEDLTTDGSKDLTLEGGFDADFLTRNGQTVLRGLLTVGRGSLAVDRLTVE